VRAFIDAMKARIAATAPAATDFLAPN